MITEKNHKLLTSQLFVTDCTNNIQKYDYKSQFHITRFDICIALKNIHGSQLDSILRQ